MISKSTISCLDQLLNKHFKQINSINFIE